MVIKVLIIDSNETKAVLIKDLLTSPGYDVDYVTCLKQANYSVESTNYDAVIINPDRMVKEDVIHFLDNAKKHNPSMVNLALLNFPPKQSELSSILSYADDYIETLSSPELIQQRIQFLIQKAQVNNNPQQHVLAIGAHPDDVEIGCGGALMKHHKNGDRITLLTLSDGSVGGHSALRREESLAAANLLNAELFWGDLQDTQISCEKETIDIIEKVIQACQPDIIYTHSNFDGHQDHRNTHLATIAATREIKNIYCYQSPTTNIRFKPHKFESIAQHIDGKLALIQCHRTQTQEKKRPYLEDDLIISTAQYWGRFAGYDMVEPFEIIRYSS